MSTKKLNRMRRSKKARIKMRETQKLRLCVNRTPRHIYAQVFSKDGSKVLVSASTLEKDFSGAATGNIEAARLIGALIAQRAVEAGVKLIAFDRSGFKYHGRVKALAEAARKNGLQF